MNKVRLTCKLNLVHDGCFSSGWVGYLRNSRCPFFSWQVEYGCHLLYR